MTKTRYLPGLSALLPTAMACLGAGLLAGSCGPSTAKKESQKQQTGVPHVVFVMGDEEYRSEESMPMLARILHRETGAQISLCYPLDSAGYVDPNRLDHIAGLKALDSADLMVLFTRFRQLPPEELRHIADFAESGRPMVGFRTATHAFRYPDSSAYAHMNNAWPARVFGQQWITHHGHFEDGRAPLTDVRISGDSSHPVLRGVKPFKAYSWLYHVDGGNWSLSGDSNPLLSGKALRSAHQEEGRLQEFPLENPVAWTKTYTGARGKPSRVFFTTLGHPYDFKDPNMRRLALNGILWSLGQPVPDSLNVGFAAPYSPNHSGFGQRFKSGMRPLDPNTFKP